ncbi:MAG: HAMP domain-containing sensor histidine kinase [Candidatus Firestonebacteria bacterium]
MNKTVFYIVGAIVAILIATSFIIVKSQEKTILKLIKQNAIQYSDTIRRSVKYHMLENQQEYVKWIIKNIGENKQITEVRILNKEGKITVSSIIEKEGCLVDKNSEGCISCHKSDGLKESQTDMTRLYDGKDKERFIGVMQPIYNEESCFKCHNSKKKILGILDVVVSLKTVDKEIYKNKRIMLLFLIITIFAVSFIVGETTSQLQKINKKLENSYLQLQEMDKMKSEFVRKVVHQLRAPINAVKSCMTVVIGGYGPIEKQIDMLKKAESRIKELIDLINDLLHLAKVEELKIVKQKERVDLNVMLPKVVEFMKEKANEKKIDLNLKLNSALPYILASYDEIEGSLINIIDNAIKYTPSSGVIEITGKTDDNIKIEIKDSGIGIQESEIPYIFDEFYRTENAKKEEKEGTGLGLTIAKKIVEVYGGRIEVKSELGKGTVFTVSLPIV